MIELKEAVEKAKIFLADIYSKDAGDFQLEEARRADDKKIWLVTFSFFQKQEPVSSLQVALGTYNKKVYKAVQVNADDGEIQGIIRENSEPRQVEAA